MPAVHHYTRNQIYPEMKKTMYIAPRVETMEIKLQEMMAGSIVAVTGNAGVELANPDEGVPGTGQSRRNDIWDDPDEENEE